MIPSDNATRLLKSLLLPLLLGAPAAWGQTDEASFAIKRYQIEGNTLIPQAEAEAAVQGLTCASCAFETIEKAIEALQNRYRAAGHGTVLVTVPEQELTEGVIRLQVIEPKIEAVQVQYDPPEGKDSFDEANIRASLPALREGEPVHTPEVSSNIQLANENPAKRIEAVLKTEDDPAKLQSAVQVNATPARKVFFTLDNTGTAETGEYRMGIGFQHANLFGLDHVATLNYITPVERPTDTNLYSASYRIPLYSLGDSIDLIVSKSDVRAATTATVAGPLQFAGSGEIYGARYNLLLPRWGEYTHRLVFGVDYWEINNQCSLGTLGSQGCGPSSADLTLIPASLTYNSQWIQAAQFVDFSFSFLHNIPGGPNGSARDYRAARPANIGTSGAPADYYLLRASLSWTRSLFDDWQIRLAANGQFTSDSLAYVQQFGLVGSSAVRGFYEREVTRDTGVVLNTEIYTPNYAPAVGVGDNLRGLAFFDYGHGRSNPLPGELAQTIDLASVGAGFQFGFRNSFQLRFNGAYVLEGANIHKTGDARAHLAVYLPFGF
ncbi:ShlB/FhaC/HecB family hemolysin secretion/activation protein [Methylomagnum sp.]